jgi:hypothetical protein
MVALFGVVAWLMAKEVSSGRFKNRDGAVPNAPRHKIWLRKIGLPRKNGYSDNTRSPRPCPS